MFGIGSFTVQGKVTGSTGNPLVGLTVLAEDVDLRHKQPLGRSTTAADGQYSISYSSSSFRRSEKGAADLLITVYTSEQRCDARDPVASSDILFNAPEAATIDVTVAANNVKQRTEYDEVVENITPILDGERIENLSPDEEGSDIKFIAGETGLDATRIHLFILAWRASKTVDGVLTPEVLYGLFREGITADLQILVTVSLEEITQALRQAISDKIISPKTEKELTAIESAFLKLAAKLSLKDPEQPSQPSPLGGILSTTGIKNPQELLEIFANHDGPMEVFWGKLQNNPNFKDKIPEIQFAGQLGLLTLSHAPLVKELQKQQKAGAISAVQDLATFSQKDWQTLLLKPEIGVPAVIPGANAQERTQKMSVAMSNLLEDAFPTKFVSSRLLDADDDVVYGGLAGKDDMNRFFRQNPKFDLTTTRFAEYITSGDSALDGIKDSNQLTNTIGAIQRIHSIAPRYTQVRPLVADGVHSSLQISRMGRNTFVSKYAPALGGLKEAHEIFERAEQSHALSASLLANFGFPSSRVGTAVWGNLAASLGEVSQQIPDLDTLFGSMDMCMCEGCRSVDGPAAYFVDILHFIRDRRLIQFARTKSDGSTEVIYHKELREGRLVDRTAKDVLFVRRPDLGEIELTCENTNTPVPYIDLCLEILEEAVSPFRPFTKGLTLPASAGADLDAATVGDWRSSFTPALSQFAIVSVVERGKRWSIDEPNFTYGIEIVGSSITVTSRSRQTKGTPQERAAIPQYQVSEAYNILNQQVYPTVLPFDLWTETVRTYLAHVTVQRWEVTEAYHGGSRTDALSAIPIAREMLGITPKEAEIIVGITTGQPGSPTSGPWNLWGFKEERDGTSGIIADPASTSPLDLSGTWNQVLTGRVDVFLQQANIVYRQLLNLLHFIPVMRRPTSERGLPQITTRNKQDPPDTCDLKLLRITNLSLSDLAQIHVFLRLWRKLSVSGWSIMDLGYVYEALAERTPDPETGFNPTSDELVLKISHIQRLQSLLEFEKLQTVLTFWTDLSTKEYIDYEEDQDASQVRSFYTQIYRNTTVTDKNEQTFPRDPSQLTGKLSDHREYITGALGISSMDFNLLVQEDGVVTDTLSLGTLSSFYRHTVLCRALEVTVSEYLVLLKLIDQNPFASTLKTVSFVERARQALDSGFSPQELNYLFRHEFTEADGVNPSDDTIALALDEMRATCQKIELDNTFEPDLTQEQYVALLGKKLPLLDLDPSVVTQAVGILNNAVTYSAPIANAPPPSLSTSALGEVCIYDSSTQLLSFSGVMTTSQRQTLDALPGADDNFKSAVSSIFDAPRKFMARYLRTFAPVDLQTTLATFPSAFTIPKSLRRKLYYDSLSSTLHSAGVLSPSELQALYKASNAIDPPTAMTEFLQAMDRITESANNIIPAAGNLFLSETDVTAICENGDLDGLPSTPLRKFTFVLAKLLPQLRQQLSKQSSTERLALGLSLDVRAAARVSQEWLKLGSQPVLEVILAPDFVKSSLSVPVKRSAASSQFDAYTLLFKSALIMSKFKFTGNQLEWIFQYRSDPTDPTNGWLDMSSLPLNDSVPNNGTVFFSGWERLLALTKLRSAIPLGQDTLNLAFTLSRSTATTRPDFLKRLAKNTGWSYEDIESISGPEVLNLPYPNAFKDEVGLTRIQKCFTLIRKISCSPLQGQQFGQETLAEVQARAAVQVVKSKYDQPSWTTVARPLRNILRERQRIALVAYLLANPLHSSVPTWRNTNNLYAHFLIDVEMGPCQLTTRIKQAVCSVQLFIQRCLLNLEPGVRADEELDGRWGEWESWLKSQVISSANRQVFMHPENYLDPSLRDDKTPFFKELEADLQQNDLTNDAAEDAYANYLEKLHVVARLKVHSFYHQIESTAAGANGMDILHVFGYTRSKPREYYYRRREDGNIWKPWNKVELDIQSDQVLPVVWNRKLHLFWLQFTEKQRKVPITMPQPDKEVPAGGTYWEVNIVWSELKGTKWLAKCVSDVYLSLPKSGTVFDDGEGIPDWSGWGKRCITCKSETTSAGGLRINLLTNSRRPGILGYFEFDAIKSAPTVTNLQYTDILQWIVAPLPDIFKDAIIPWKAWLSLPVGCVVDNMAMTENHLLNMLTLALDFPLSLPTSSYPGPFNTWLTPQIAQKFQVNVVTLRKTPGLEYSVVSAPQDQQFTCQQPFFFQHDQRVFFVEPHDTHFFTLPRDVFNVRDRFNLGLLDGKLFASYVERQSPVRPIIDRVIRAPGEDVGFLRGAETFDLSNEFRTIKDVSVKRSDLSASPSPLALEGTAKLNLSSYVVPTGRTNLAIPSTKQFGFSLFYHPYVKEFMSHLNRDGVPGLLQRPLQQLKPNLSHTFKAQYDPLPSRVPSPSAANETVDFSVTGSFSQYNWELFYHVPMLIADKLMGNQRFKEARQWLHYIFDPTDTSSLPKPKKFWITKPFVQTEKSTYAAENVVNIFRLLAKRGNPAALAALSDEDKELLSNLENSVREWRKNPFNPFLVARTRTVAFQMATVMKYLDVLIAWGDQLFRRDTIEAINEATQLYLLASSILGERPAEIPARAVPKVQTYNSIDSKLDEISNALVRIEELIPTYTTNRFARQFISPIVRRQAVSPTMLLFCVPRNAKLLSYWDTVSDRLFKIRHCMNLQGIVRELALWDPPIDPMLLIKAKAAGMDLSSALNNIDAGTPLYRFSIMVANASDLINEVRGLGNALLTALEKKDAEGLSLLRSDKEIRVLQAVMKIKEQQITESDAQVSALTAGKEVVNERFEHYRDISFMNPWEITHIALEGAALVLQTIEAATQPVAAMVTLVPDIKIGAPTSLGATFGGNQLGTSASLFGAFLNRTASLLTKTSGMAATMGTYARRSEDWDLQRKVASRELTQFDVQIKAANIRKAIAEKELENHELQTDNAKAIDEYMKSKFSNEELYSWMTGQVSALYFQSYQLAFDAARRAERAYSFELGVDKADFIQFGNWDSLRKGLLAGDKLHLDLKRLETAYLEQDSREYELTKTISLAHLDPVAFLQFKQDGQCLFSLPEALFDLDCAGHYMRRIKSVSLTIPCIAGPYVNISAKLSLLKSTIRTSNILSSGKKHYGRTENDIRFRDVYAHIQSIVTSTAVNDSGTFELNLRDERYLPFERAGAISSWRIEIPTSFNQIDYGTITDVLVQLRYTAREGGEILREQATLELRQKTLNAIAIAEGQSGLARLIDVRNEMSDAWNRFLRPVDATKPQQITLPLTKTRFPYFVVAATSITITTIELFVQINPAVADTHTPDALKIYLHEAGTQPSPADLLTLNPWKNQTLKGTSRAWNKPPGNWMISGGLTDLTTRIDSDAFVQFFMVVHYTTRWS